MPRSAITVWTRGHAPKTWSKEIFKDLGFDRLVRVYLGWFAGEGPGKPGMVEDNSVVSELEPGGSTMRDTRIYEGSGMTPEVDTNQDPVFLDPAVEAMAVVGGVVMIEVERT